MPECCGNCPFVIKDMRLKTGLCAIWECLHDDMCIIPPDFEKPDWCPLLPLPQPMKVDEIHVDEYFCPACGAENCCNDGVVQDKFCPECGQKLNWEN